MATPIEQPLRLRDKLAAAAAITAAVVIGTGYAIAEKIKGGDIITDIKPGF